MEATWAGSPSEVTRVLDTSVMAVTHNTAAFLDSLFSLVDVDLCSASYVYLLYSPFQRSDFVETEVATSNSPTFRWTHSSAPPPVWPPSPSSWVRSCWGETRFFKFYFLCCVMSVNIALKKTWQMSWSISDHMLTWVSQSLCPWWLIAPARETDTSDTVLSCYLLTQKMSQWQNLWQKGTSVA